MPADDELDALLEAVLARAGEPLSVAAARKALPAGRKPALAEVGRRLDALLDRGRVHRWPGRAAKFSSVSPASLARECVLRALSSGPLTEAELKRRVPAAVRTLVKPSLAALTGERVVTRHPRLGARRPFGLRPPDVRDYLSAEIETALRRLVKLGFPEAELRAALRRHGGGSEPAPVPEAGGAQEIVAAMSRLNGQAARGALVHVAELRAAVGQRFGDKEAFDRAVLALAERGTVQLQSHAWPARLTESEKAALVPNGRGGFYDAIGLRLE